MAPHAVLAQRRLTQRLQLAGASSKEEIHFCGRPRARPQLKRRALAGACPQRCSVSNNGWTGGCSV